MQDEHSGIMVRSNKKAPRTKKYPFEILVKRGQSFFLPGADAHKVRQAALSYEKYHPEIAKAGDKIRANKDRDATGERPDAPMVDGVAVHRVSEKHNFISRKVI